MGLGFSTFPGAEGGSGVAVGSDGPQIGCKVAGSSRRGPWAARRVLRAPVAPFRSMVLVPVLAILLAAGSTARAQVATDLGTGGAGTLGQPVAPALPSTTLVTPLSPLSIGEAAVVRPLWTFNPRISVDQSFTDNANGGPPGNRESDLYTTIRPGALIDLSSHHHRFTLDYTFTRRQYVFNEDLRNNQHGLSTFSQSELVDGIFFLDTQTSLSDATLNSQGQVSADPTVQFEGNSATIFTASASPFLRYQLDKYANFETRYRYGRTLSLTEGAQDSESHRFTHSVASGREFDRFSWGGTFDIGREDFTGMATFGPTGDRTNRNLLGVGSVEVPIIREFSIALSAGYEKIEDLTLEDQPDGPIWNVGFRYRPGPRTTLQMGYGDRYDRKRLSGGLSYIISPRSSFTFSYGQTIRQTTPTANNSVAFLAPDGFGNLVDVRTGQGLSFSDSVFGLTSSSFYSERMDATLSLGHGLASSTINFFMEKRSGSTTQSDEDAIGITYGYTRPLNAYLSMNFQGSFSKSETTGTTPATTPGTAINVNTNALTNGSETRLYTSTVGGSLNYNISDTMSATLSYTFFRRDSSDSGGDSSENLLTAGIRKSF